MTRDLEQATADAAQFLRHYDMGERLSRTNVTHKVDDDVNINFAPTNAAIEALQQSQSARALGLVKQHRAQLAEAPCRAVDCVCRATGRSGAVRAQAEHV